MPGTYQGKVYIGGIDGTDLQELATVTVPIECDGTDNIYRDLSAWEFTAHIKNKRRLVASLCLCLSKGESKMPRKKMRKYRRFKRKLKKPYVVQYKR